jgi:hypothetical protein
MEPVVRVITSYPTFLWITWCKILFIVSDQIWTTFSRVKKKTKKKTLKSL